MAPYEKGDPIAVCHDTDIPVVVIKGDTIPQIILQPNHVVFNPHKPSRVGHHVDIWKR